MQHCTAGRQRQNCRVPRPSSAALVLRLRLSQAAHNFCHRLWLDMPSWLGWKRGPLCSVKVLCPAPHPQPASPRRKLRSAAQHPLRIALLKLVSRLSPSAHTQNQRLRVLLVAFGCVPFSPRRLAAAPFRDGPAPCKRIRITAGTSQRRQKRKNLAPTALRKTLWRRRALTRCWDTTSRSWMRCKAAPT